MIRYVHLLWLDAISRFWTPISRFLLLVILNFPDFYLAKVDRSDTHTHTHTCTHTCTQVWEAGGRELGCGRLLS